MQTFLKLALRFLLLTRFRKYRRIIGVGGVVGIEIVKQLLCSQHLQEIIPALASACAVGGNILPLLETLAAYTGGVGILDMDGRLTSIAGGTPGATGDLQRPGA